MRLITGRSSVRVRENPFAVFRYHGLSQSLVLLTDRMIRGRSPPWKSDGTQTDRNCDTSESNDAGCSGWHQQGMDATNILGVMKTAFKSVRFAGFVTDIKLKTEKS